MIAGIAVCSLMRLRLGHHWYATRYGQHLVQWWMQRMAHYCGIQINQYNQPRSAPVFYVANHISFIDIIVIGSVTPTIFLSKNSVRYWPLVGQLSSLGGVIYIKRGRRNLIARIIASIRDALIEGRAIVVFPEGTTTLGLQPLKFHAGLFQAAIDAQSPVQAIALRYCDTPENCHAGRLDRTAAYIEKDNLLLNLYRIIRRPVTYAHVRFCVAKEVSKTEGRTELAEHCRQQIIDALNNNYAAHD